MYHALTTHELVATCLFRRNMAESAFTLPQTAMHQIEALDLKSNLMTTPLESGVFPSLWHHDIAPAELSVHDHRV